MKYFYYMNRFVYKLSAIVLKMQLRSGKTVNKATRDILVNVNTTGNKVLLTVNAKQKVLSSSRRRSPRNYKNIDYTGMDTIESESDDKKNSDPDWLPSSKLKVVATTKPNVNDHPVIKLIKKYLDYFHHCKNKYYKSCGTLKQEKLFVIEVSRIILELYSIINEYFDELFVKNDCNKLFEFSRVVNSKAHQLINSLYEYRSNQRYTGNDLSLINNCIHEMENYRSKYNDFISNFVN